MAAKAGPPTVQTYRIGVQNRYSAFLEGDECLALSNVQKRPSNEGPTKQKSSLSAASKTSGGKSNGKTETSSAGANKKQDAQAKGSSSANNQQAQMKGGSVDTRRQQRDGGKPQQRQQQQHQQQQQQLSGPRMPGNQARNQNNRVRYQNQDGYNTANGTTRSPRNQMNGNAVQQLNASQQFNKENQPSKGTEFGNPRFNRQRTQNGDKRVDHQQDSQQINGHLPSSEGEKARHQQRRLNNLRFKDPEKRERRNQVADSTTEMQQPKSDQQLDGDANSREQRAGGLKARRDGEKIQDLKNKARPQRRLDQNGGGAPQNGERRDVRRDRPVRQRNGMSGSHSDGGKHDKPKPIPNFSDKSDFPSLAS